MGHRKVCSVHLYVAGRTVILLRSPLDLSAVFEISRGRQCKWWHYEETDFLVSSASCIECLELILLPSVLISVSLFLYNLHDTSEGLLRSCSESSRFLSSESWCNFCVNCYLTKLIRVSYYELSGVCPLPSCSLFFTCWGLNIHSPRFIPSNQVWS